jgi:histone H3/H4
MNQPLTEQLDRFWNEQMAGVEQLCHSNKDFKNHNDLPLARIKRIMKSDEGVYLFSCNDVSATTAPTHTCSSPPSAHVFSRILWWSVSCGTDVRMIRAEAPVLFAKACELFILELTLRSSCFSEKTERRNLQKSDILAALHHTPIFDFLDAVVNQPKQ